MFQSMKENCIILSGLKQTRRKNVTESDLVHYERMSYVGDFLKPHIENAKSGLKGLSLMKVKKRKLIVLVDANEVAKLPGVRLIGDKNCVFTHHAGNEQGYAIIFLAPAIKQKLSDFPKEWNRNDTLLLKKIKPNICKKKGSTHFGTSGVCYAFGSVGNYLPLNKYNGMSVHDYVNKGKMM